VLVQIYFCIYRLKLYLICKELDTSFIFHLWVHLKLKKTQNLKATQKKVRNSKKPEKKLEQNP
jgi:hypothetical protein